MSNNMTESPFNFSGPLIKKSQYPVAVIIFLMLAFGIYGFVQTMLHGHHAWGTSDQIPWGILLATYVFFVVSSTGLCLSCSIGSVFQLDPYKSMGVRDVSLTLAMPEESCDGFGPCGVRGVLLALIGLIVGFIVIAIELAHPFVLLKYIFISPNFSSTILLMGLLYGLYMVFLILELWFMLKRDHRLTRIFASLAFVSAIVAHSNLGAVFGLIGARSFWYGPYLPIYFILSAFVSGAAILIILFYLVQGKKDEKENHERLILSLGKFLAMFTGISIFFNTWKLISGVAHHVPGKYEAVMALLNGPLSLNFWLFEVLIGLVSPFLIILFAGRKVRAVFAAAILSIIGIFVMRYDLVIAGQIVPQQIDLTLPITYLTYTPTVAEWGIVVGALALVPIFYVLSMRLVLIIEGYLRRRRKFTFKDSKSVAK